jgi:hypothetical protein
VELFRIHKSSLLLKLIFIISISGYLGVLKAPLVMILFLIVLVMDGKNVKLNKSIVGVYVFLVIWSIVVFQIKLIDGVNFSRFYMQQIKLLAIIFEITLGFYLIQKMRMERIVLPMLFVLKLLVILGVYQVIAIKFNLPNWAMYYDSNKIAYDAGFGQRISSLAGEPKYFAVVLSLLISYLFYKLLTSSASRFDLVFLFLSFICLYYSASALGYVATALALLISFIWAYNNIATSRKLYVAYVLMIFVCYILLFSKFDIYDIFSRASHKELLEGIAFNLDTVLIFDDLVKIPLLVWINHFYYIITGYGYGLLHLFALEFIGEASWYSVEMGYIDSNVGFISQVSNYGVVLFSVFIVSAYKLSKNTILNKDTSVFLFVVITIPFIIGAIDLVPSYFFFGCLLGLDKYHLPTVNVLEKV